MHSRVRFVAALVAILLAAACLFQGVGAQDDSAPSDIERVAGPLAH